MYCSTCGTKNDEMARFCQGCGRVLNASMNGGGISLENGVGNPANIIDFSVGNQPNNYAGFWRRVGASMIDSLIINFGVLCLAVPVIIFSAIGMVLQGLEGTHLENAIEDSFTWISYLITMLVGWLYYGLFESSAKQATPGKMALAIKVTDMKGNRISFGQASGRFFASFLSSLIFGFGYLLMLFTDKKQNLHDLMAGTLVLEK